MQVVCSVNSRGPSLAVSLNRSVAETVINLEESSSEIHKEGGNSDLAISLQLPINDIY
jgi:hypothetical protein